MNELVIIKCEYYPEFDKDSEKMFLKEMSKYNLVKLEDEDEDEDEE
ncbi:MAG: hypothetical protein GQ540_03470 [Lutibacter sp.]|nr:hypothetical protein [Lutibacter sp.]NOR27572.1 hypothetical protein [Lutibacter sp.]